MESIPSLTQSGSHMVCFRKIWLSCFWLCNLMVTPAFSQNSKAMEAKQGRLDLQSWSPENILSLQGEWLFFPNQLLTPEAFRDKLQSADALPFTRVGKSFAESNPTLYPDNFGTATYALILTNVPKIQLGLAKASVYTSGLILVFSQSDTNSPLAHMNIGWPADTKDKTQPSIGSSEILPFLTGTGQETVILIQVSNFHHNWGGLWIPPQIALYKNLIRQTQSMDKLNYWLLGLIFFLGLYNISLFIRRPEDQASLFLAIFSAAVAIRLFVLAEESSRLFSNPAWAYEFNLKVVYVSMAMNPALFLYFLNSCFPLRLQTRTVHWITAINVLPSLLVVFTAATFYGHLGELLKFCAMGTSLVGLWILIRACLARDEGSMISLGGSVAMLIGLLLDVLSSYGFESFDFLPSNSTPIGMSAFIICQSQIVASRFARAFRQSEHLSRELQSEVEKQTRDIKSILTNIRQGIFTISRDDRKIDELHSEYLKELTGVPDIHGQSLRSLILDRSNLSEDRKSTTEASLDSAIGEQLLCFEVNSGNLVREMEYHTPGSEQKQIFELDWNPILRRDETVEKVLVSIRDVTELRALEAQSRKQEEDMRVIMDLIRIPEDRFHRFVDKTMDYLKENRELIALASDNKADVVKRLFVNMHTIKGAARTYYLQAISSASHDVEQYYAALQKQSMPWDKVRLLDDLNKVEQAVGLYKTVGESRLGWQSQNKAVKMSRKEIEYTLEMLAHLENLNLTKEERDSLQEAERVLLENCYTELPGVIDEACRGIDSMARDLGKAQPILAIQTSQVVLKDNGADLLHSLMTHLLRNSLDHGIEKPDERVRKGKPERGTIHMWTETNAPYLYIHFADDGNGLNLVKLEKIGRQRGLISSKQSPTDQEIAELIFRSGLSTKDEISDISGRGVGLDAVRSYLEDQGGAIQVMLNSVKDREHAPFTLIMNIPLSLCFLAKVQNRAVLEKAG